MHLSEQVIGHLPIMASGEEIMTVIFISSTCCLSPHYSSFQGSPSACAERDGGISSISFLVGGCKHKPDIESRQCPIQEQGRALSSIRSLPCIKNTGRETTHAEVMYKGVFQNCKRQALKFVKETPRRIV